MAQPEPERNSVDQILSLVDHLSKDELKELRGKLDERSKTDLSGKNQVSLLEMVSKMRSLIPQEDWDKLPTDLARNVDHYLYGSPKSNL